MNQLIHTILGKTQIQAIKDLQPEKRKVQGLELIVSIALLQRSNSKFFEKAWQQKNKNRRKLDQ